MAQRRPWENGGPEARWDGYFLPGTSTLRNRLGITDPARLAVVENLAAINAERAYRSLPEQDRPDAFDFAHLSDIHQRLFGRVYDWAGEPRTVDIAKGGGRFERHQDVVARTDELGEILAGMGNLRGMGRDDFAQVATAVYNPLNQIHAFREGNGRAQRVYLDDLAEGSELRFDWTQVRGVENDAACEAALGGDLAPMQQMLTRICAPPTHPSFAPATPAGQMAALRAIAYPAAPRAHPPAPGANQPRRGPGPPTQDPQISR